MAKLIDTFETWRRQGILEERLRLIKDLSLKQATQEEIASNLRLSQKTFIKLRNAHPEIVQAMTSGELELKKKLIDAVIMKAIGFEHESVDTYIEDNGGRPKKKLHKQIKYYPPDFAALKYLLIVKYGRDFNDRKEELDLMAKKFIENKEVWDNDSGDNTDED